MVYMLYRVPNLTKIDDEYIELMKNGISGSNLGCFLIVMGLNKEIEQN